MNVFIRNSRLNKEGFVWEEKGLIWLLSFDIQETVFTFRIVQQFIEIIIV